jgi:hypothetical protein
MSSGSGFGRESIYGREGRRRKGRGTEQGVRSKKAPSDAVRDDTDLLQHPERRVPRPRTLPVLVTDSSHPDGLLVRGNKGRAGVEEVEGVSVLDVL